MKTARFSNAWWAESGNSFYGPFRTQEDAEQWYVGKGPHSTQVLGPDGSPYTPSPPPLPRKPRTVPAVPLPNPRRKGPPEPRYGMRDLEEAQWGWERRHAVLRAYRTGSITHAKLAEFMGFSTGFISQLIATAEREEKWGHNAPFMQFRDRSLFWADTAWAFQRKLNRSVAIADMLNRDWIFVATPGFE